MCYENKRFPRSGVGGWIFIIIVRALSPFLKISPKKCPRMHYKQNLLKNVSLKLYLCSFCQISINWEILKQRMSFNKQVK